MRTTKSDPRVELVDLIEANPSFALVQYPDGRKSKVSTSDLADPGINKYIDEDPETTTTRQEPSKVTCEEGTNKLEESMNDHPPNRLLDNDFEGFRSNDKFMETHPLIKILDKQKSEETKPLLRRSTRDRRPPDRYSEN